MGRVSSEDIARAANVSRTTVSYVLNDRPGRRISAATRQRILDTAKELGYVPDPAALALRAGQSQIVLLHERTPIPAPGQEVLARGSTGGLLRDALAREVRSWGMTLLSSGEGFPLAEVLAHLTPRLVIAPAGLSPADRAALEQASILWYGTLPDGRAPDAALTDGLARTIAGHLADRGHRVIGYVDTGVPEFAGMAAERAAAIERACAEVGLSLTHRISLGIVGEDAVAACQGAFVGWHDDGITAVACFNDLHAGVALKAAQRLGWRVPEGLAVIGVDDEPMAALLDPPLTTVRQSVAEFGAHLAACGRAVLDGVPVPALDADVTPLVLRRTT